MLANNRDDFYTNVNCEYSRARVHRKFDLEFDKVDSLKDILLDVHTHITNFEEETEDNRERKAHITHTNA